MTQDDVDAGSVVNVVKANATAVRGDDPAEVQAQATVTTEAAEAKLSITKEASKTEGAKVDDEITYTVKVTNTGNVSVNTGKLEDDHADLSDKTFALAPDETATFTYTYKVTQDDVDAGEFTNTVKANATAVRGDAPEEVTATATVKAVDPEAAISVDKTASPTSGVKVSDEITYTVVVTNTGNVSISGIKLVDEKANADQTDLTTKIAPNGKKTFTYTYTVTQDDIDAGEIVNLAVATGADPKGKEVTANDSATVTAEESKPSVSITKEASKTADAAVDDEITYTITVTNTGNVTLKDILVEDELSAGDVTFADDVETNSDGKAVIGELAPKATATITATYTVTQADVDAQDAIENKATVTATPARGDDVTDEATVETTVVAKEAKLTVTKKTTSTALEGGYKLGDTVSYKITVKNDGNVTITDITVTDERTGDEWTVDSLEPGAEQTFTTSTTVTEADILSGHILNDATATGSDPQDEEPTVTPGNPRIPSPA